MTTSDLEDSMSSPSTSCVVIGEGNLLLYCLKHLIDKDFDVVAVFSDTEQIQEYCGKNNLKHNPRNGPLEDAFHGKNVDYLFSISNPRILKESVLRLPRKFSINYHDSPLPKYAGVHATSWAIIQGEVEHGISWHVVETGIDTGDILQFKSVKILRDDSALTLNLKCQEAAKETFVDMVSQISENTVFRSKQAHHGRSYFGLYAIPPNIGVLSFNTTCAALYNLGRGLEFGHHENALGSPKILTSSSNFLLVTSIEIASKRQVKNVKPGTIIDIFDDTVVVTSSVSPVLLSMAKLDGSTLPPSSYREHGLVVGRRLSSDFILDAGLLLDVRKKETFWRRKMACYEPTTFFLQRMNVVADIIDVSTDINLRTISVPLPDLTWKRFPPNADTTEQIVPAFISFIGRITGEEKVCLGLLADKSRIPIQAQPLYADICPGLFHIDLQSDVQTVLSGLQEQVTKFRNSHSFLVDMFYRYPELRGQKRTPHHNIVIGMINDEVDMEKVAMDVLHDCNMVLLFNKVGRNFHLMYSDRPGHDYGHIVDVLKHFPTFLRSIDPYNGYKTSILSKINLVTKEEMEILYPVQVFPKEPSDNIYELFVQQTLITPNNVALKSTFTSFTYQQTRAIVDEMDVLLKNVSKEERIVGLHLPNSIAYVVSVLSVLKSGRAFVPLPIDFPSERLTFTSKDANVRSVLTTQSKYERSNFEGMPSNPQVSKPLEVGGNDIVLVQFPFQETYSTIPKPILLPTDICYVMYTSGSTGRPKGVKVLHSGVANLARAQIDIWGIEPSDVIAQFASIGFDATISEIFTALFSGATLALLTDGERLGQEFIHAMNELNVTTITLAPSAWNIYGQNDLPKLTKVVTAGEACTLGTAVKWTTENPKVRFFNAYGPTEATVCATCYEYVASEHHEDVNQDLPIGKPIPGACVYLLDKYLNPVPPDVVGEIYIGGKGVSDGYLGHAEDCNKNRFIQNPMTNTPMRLYKTGDHAFQDISGNLTYIGRTDDMVKIRGQRVDLSEIEQVLIQHPKVEIAVVVVHKCSKSSERSIAAYLAPTFVYISELREYLSKVLPKYMVPTFIKKLDVTDFKMTLNGKIDRKSLEADESVHTQEQSSGSSHLNDIQLAVAKLWCNILKLDETAYYDFHRQTSFSELGGNSLQLVLLQRTLEDALQVKLSFTDLGTADTIEEFSEVVKRKKDMLRISSLPALENEENLRNLILRDSTLALEDFPNNAKKRSMQFKFFSAFGKRTAYDYPRNVLISGVTGFLGAYLMAELLENTNAHICCMVRESTEARGLGRIIENLRKYDLWKVAFAPRIAIVISDLSQPKLGIAPDIYKGLSNSIDVIFMNAAMMNFNTGYQEHRVANVFSTKEFIQFALTGTQKYLFTTSSLGVFLFPKSGPSRQRFYEYDNVDDPCKLEGGYNQSKWASERLVRQALQHLPGGAIFRPARVSGSSQTGIGSKNDLFALSLLGMHRFGSYPDMDFPYDLTPVDFCAKAIVEIALKICNDVKTSETVFHLFNPETIPFCDLFKDMNLKPLPLEEWRNKLKHAEEDQKELIPLTPFFLSSFWDRSPNWPVFDTSNTNKYISNDTKKLLKSSSELLLCYKKYFKLSTENGFH